MLQSRFTYRFALKISVFFIFINFFIASFCTIEEEYPRKGHYSFDISSFLIANSYLLTFCIVLFLISYSQKRKIKITADKIIVRSPLSSKNAEFLFSEISGLSWGFANKRLGARFSHNMRSTTQNITVLFKDESELNINNYEYRNYDELKDFFYDYCRKNNLVEETYSQKRRNSRRRYK